MANEIVDFLARFPPFDRLDAAELLRVATSVATRSYRAGEDVLVEDGAPASHLFVVRSGSMELVHEEEVIDVLEHGECFGHPSLLTGMAPAFTVRAHEDSVCYLIDREAALRVLGGPAGVSFVAATLRERLTRTGHTVHALPELRTTRIGVLVAGPPVFCEPERSVREAAREMTRHRVSAVLVPTPDGLGIVTEADLREKVVAGDVPPEAPVTRVMTRPIHTVASDRLAADATLDMLDAGIHHLAVVDAAGKVLGVVSASDLMGLEGRSPFALRRAIVHAPDEDALVAACSQLPRLFVALLDAGLSAPDIGRVLTLMSDSTTARLIDFAFVRRGPAPAAWAWLALGSGARRELTLASDQDNALAYADMDDPVATDAFFGDLARDVNAGLARCGFGRDTADVAASHPLWRMSESAWRRVFQECFEQPDGSHLVRAAVSFDFRHAAGGLAIVPLLVSLLRSAGQHPDFIRRLARTATDLRPPLGLRQNILVRRDKEGAGGVDIKKGGVVPIANLARFHALANGITISATLDRLTAAEQTGALDRETAESLREAFGLISKVRLEHHADEIQAGVEPDNVVDLERLMPLTRAALREAFRAIARAQKRLGRYVPLGL